MHPLEESSVLTAASSTIKGNLDDQSCQSTNTGSQRLVQIGELPPTKCGIPYHKFSALSMQREYAHHCPALHGSRQGASAGGQYSPALAV